jgi:Mg2+/Co2+ transporter CorB
MDTESIPLIHNPALWLILGSFLVIVVVLSLVAIRHRSLTSTAVAGPDEGTTQEPAQRVAAHRERLLGALNLAERTVDEVMKHRRQIEMIDADLPPGEIITRVLASPHTRLPIFRDSDDTILGVVHAKDLLREVDRLVRGEDGSVAGIDSLDIVKVAMKPYFIPDTTTLDEQMRVFLARRTHFALVVDEYGTLQGLITLEDILEEIVGDITDEFDVVRDAGLTQTGDGAYLIDGAMTIRDLNRATDWHLPDDEANTIAGLVIHEAQMIPNEGQTFSFHGFRFTVIAKRENRITRLKLRPL